MDPLSITASLIAIIQLATTATQFLKEIKSGSEDRIRLREEIRTTSCLLEILRDRVDDADALGQDLSSIKSLNVPGGPLDQMSITLQKLMKKLVPANRLLKKSQAVLWPLSRGDVNDFLNTIERQKAAFNMAIQNDNIGLSLAIKDHVSGIASKLDAIELRHERSQKRFLDEDDQKIVSWLSPTTFWARHQDIMSYRTEDTGKWFLETREFNQWVNGTDKTLWCPGIPGAGKTVIASIVVDHLQTVVLDDKMAVAFIYCNYKERAQQTLTNLLSSLARQLIDRSNSIPETLRSSYSRHCKNGTRLSHIELLELLADIELGFSSLFIVIDALDECNSIDGTRSSLVSSLRKYLHNRTRLLFTSRPSGDIESLLDDCPQLEIRASERDIRCHVSSRLMSEPRLVKHVAADAGLLNEILDNIVARSDGMFLLAQLHIGALSRKHNKKAIRSALHALPTEIDNTYHEAMQRIDDQSEEDVCLAKDILTWVHHAITPLSIDELQHALAMSNLEGDKDIDEEDLTDSEILVSICAGLVTIDKESNLVRLIHYTAQEYFDRNPILTPSNAQEKITKTCISYLLLSDIAQGPCSNDRAMLQRFSSKPFLGYAAKNWGIHARGEPELACRETIVLFINDEDARASAFQAAKMSIIMLRGGFFSLQFENVPRLVFAASFGLTNIVKYFLAHNEDIEASDNHDNAALKSAAAGGHTDTVEALLAAGADIDKEDFWGDTALTLAVVNDHEDTVNALVSKGASLQAGPFIQQSPLRAAVRCGHMNMVSLFIENGATMGENPSILEAAFCSQNAKLVEMVLDQMSRDQQQLVIKTSLKDYLSPQYRISSAICNLLLRRGADINLCNSMGESLLHIAAQEGLPDIAELLLDHGMDPNIKASNGFTPLHWAIFRGNLIIVELLLERGASIDAQSGAGETVLHTCVQHNPHNDILTYLIEFGVLLNQSDFQGRTSLHLAAQRGLSEAVISMVEKGADIHARDHQGWIPLQHAAANGHAHIFNVLTDDYAEIQQPNYKSLLESARLCAAIASKDSHVVESLLCNHELDVNGSDYKGSSFLHLAAATGQINVVTALLNRGASVHARTVDMADLTQYEVERRVAENTFHLEWITPLHLAVENGYGEITEILLKYGASVNAAGPGGENILDVALHNHHAHIGRILLEKGATIDRNRAGNHLWDAIRINDKDIVRLLADNGADMSWMAEADLRALHVIPDEILDILKTPKSAK